MLIENLLTVIVRVYLGAQSYLSDLYVSPHGSTAPSIMPRAGYESVKCESSHFVFFPCLGPLVLSTSTK